MNSILRRRRGLMGAKSSGGLPSAYQRVAWIESSGTQCIQTSYIPNTLTELYMDFTINEIPPNSTTYFCIFGEMEGNNPYNRFTLHLNSAYNYLSRGSTEGTVVRFMSAGERYEVISTPPKQWSFNGNVISAGDNDFTKATTLPFAIFGRNRSGSIDRKSKIKLYSFSIKENSETKLNLIPCYRKADSVIGLYDAISGTFYTNSGTGTFTKGADVT